MNTTAEGHGAEFIEAVLRDGGEGVVAKPFAAHFGFDWVKIKRVQTEDCLVTEIHPFKHSVRLSQNGVDRGWCSIGRNKISVGEVVEIECYGITANDKFREPRFARSRPDKI
jgi:ATP-dependent DNA ligase